MKHTQRRKNRRRPLCLLDCLEPRALLAVTPIGVNVEPLADWSRSFMFVDAMRTTRVFGSPDTPWDGAAPHDANGWPTADFGACIITVDSPGSPVQNLPAISGTYTLVANGNADIAPAADSLLTIANKHYDPDTNTLTANVIVKPGATQVFLSFTNTDDGEGGQGLKNIHLYRPGYQPDTTQTFTTAFLDSLAPFQTLRFMDFTRTNNNTISDWADRPLPSYAFLTTDGGAPWEVAIQLANETHKDIWINIPAQASDDYVTQLATLMHDTLDPTLKIYLEYSNEVWNPSFQQYDYNFHQAVAEESADPTVLDYDNSGNPAYWAWRRIALQLEHDESIFAGIYGTNSINTTIRPVLASQIGSPFVLRNQLEFLNHFYGDLSQSIYAVAGAPYIDIGSLSTDPNLTVNQVITALQDDIANIVPELERFDALAQYYGLKNLSYEAGTVLEGDTNGNFINAKLPANYDPRIAGIINQYLAAAYSCGSQQIMYYNASNPYGTWGCWGLTENIYNLADYKFAALSQFADQSAPASSAGAQLPADGSLSINAGNYTANAFEDYGPGGDIHSPLPGYTFDFLLNSQGSAATVSLNIATPTGGQVQYYLDNQLVGQQDVPNTTQNWIFTDLAPINISPDNVAGKPLSAGLHTFRIVIVSGDLTIHALNVTTSTTPAPNGLVVTPSSPNQLTLSWNHFQNETGFLVERTTDPDNVPWTAIANTVVTGDIDHSGLVDGKDFDVWFTHIGQSTSNWLDGDLNGDGLVDGKDFDLWFTHIGQAYSPAAVPTFIDTDVQANTIYYYRVRALTAAGISPYSQILTFTP